MATTTNFGWETPDDTDLVKDGALAMRTLGNAIDTSLVDLKGGTTGQVLSKTSNTDMDFTWVTSDDANAIQNAIVDAKGDLIAASAADTPARLAVGNNGETLVCDSSTSTGLRYQSGYNGNAIINGGMDIWQRGTSFTSFNQYTADRWYISFGATGTVSQQSAGSTLPQFQYCARVGRNSGNTTAGYQQFFYALETKDSLRFAGQTVTVSFYARAGANFSAASNQMGFILYSGTGTDQKVDAYTGSVAVINQNPTLTTSWQRFQYTGTVGSTATELGVNLYYLTSGTAGANDWFEITGVQMELGSVATTWKRAGNTLQQELAACQRYYIRTTGNNSSALLGTLGFAKSTSLAVMPFALPVTMRAAVSAIDTGGTPQIADGNTGYSGGTWALDSSSSTGCTVTYTHGSASLTQYRPYFPQATTGTSYIGFSAEL